MKKIYVVCEDYTTSFFGLYVDEKEAKEKAEFINGYILEYPYTVENNKLVVDLKENNDEVEENEC